MLILPLQFASLKERLSPQANTSMNTDAGPMLSHTTVRSTVGTTDFAMQGGVARPSANSTLEAPLMIMALLKKLSRFMSKMERAGPMAF